MVVVGDAGDDGRVRCQGQCGQRFAIDPEAVDEFRSDMLSVGGAAAVAKN